MASMSVSGVVSGMDWESMIESVLESAQKPAMVQVNKKTNLTNKKSLFEEMKVTMNSIQTSLSPLKLASTYKAKEIEIERIDTSGSYKGVLTATVNADAEVNVYDLKVNQLATAQTNRSKQITSSNLKSTLGSIESSKMYINAGGQKIGVDVYNTDTLESLKSRINTTLKTLSTPLAVTASVVDNKLILKSDYTGLGTTSVTGTTRDKYNASGFTDLSTIITNADSGASTNIVIDESNLDNLKVMSGTKTYSIHKDYEVINNQIRWKQYEDTDNVKLGESITASYTMGAGDVFSKTVKKGSDDTDSVSLGFDVIDNGTLSQRMTITGKKTTSTITTDTKYSLSSDEEIGTTTSTETSKDDDGNEVVTKTTVKITENDDGYYDVETTVAVTKLTDFYYGKDFTYKDGEITWLEQGATTNEPASYTVSYERDNSFTYEVTGGNSPKYVDINNEPDNYSVKITVGDTGSYITDAEKRTTTAFTQININFDELNAQYSAASGKDLTFSKIGTWSYAYLDPDSAYLSNFTITTDTDTDKEYVYGRDFIIATIDNTTTNTSSDNFQIIWAKNPSESSVGGIVANYISHRDVPSGTSQDFPAQGSNITLSFAYDNQETLSGKVSAADNDKTLETIFGKEIDPAYYENLKIRGYTYGSDYEVNNEGEIVWRTKSEYVRSADEDNMEVSVENFNAAYKKATGSDEVPTLTLIDSDGVIRTYIDPEDRSLFKMTSTFDGETTEYEYGRDYVIRVNDDGNGYVFSWFVANDKNLDNVYDAKDANIVVSTYAKEKKISTLNFKVSPEAGPGYTFSFSSGDKINDKYSKAVTSSDDDKDLTLSGLFGKDFELDEDNYSDIVITSGSGDDAVTYKYGLDFTITDGEIVWLPKYDATTTTETNEPASYTLSYPGLSDVSSDDTDGIANLIDVIATTYDEDYSNITITDSDGKTYSYVATEAELDKNSFTINDDGKLTWYSYEVTTATTSVIYTPNAPDKGTEYTINYESFKPIETTGTYDYSDFEVKLLNDNGKISGSSNSYLSYEQILKDANSKLTASSLQDDIDTALAKVFTLTDEDGETYTYGTDYRIVMGNEDSSSGQHKAVLEWLGGDVPAYNNKFTISYTGRGNGGGEVLEIKDAVTRSNSDVVMSGIDGTPIYSEFKAGTTTITQGTKTFYEGIDFEIGKNDADNVVINWKTGEDSYEWYYPSITSQYTINLTNEDGVTKTYMGARGYRDTLDLRNLGFSKVSDNGTLNSITYNGTTYDLTSTTQDENGKTPSDIVKETLGININEGTSGGVRAFNFDWINPVLTSREGLPGYGDDISIDYEYNVNTFSLSDDGDGVIDALGLNDDITEAQNAILVLDGEEVQRDSNDIGESYENELIKGMTIHLKGVGEVSMDVSHDAEKAVESIQTFVDNYNSLMSWMNTRMTESQVDEDTAATIDSDDFRMRWGLLHGNSLLRNTKSQMRDITAQNFTYSFTSRSSSDEIYGSMAYNGLKTDSTLRLRINSTYVDVPVLRTDTLQDIVDKISDSSNPAMRNIFYGDDGQLLTDPLIKAKIEGDKLVISSSSNSEITMSGTAAMNALKMNYTYKGVYQLGIATTSTDYGKSGELEFDTEKFMTALEDNPDEVQALMLKYASAMDTWTKSMLNTSSSGATSGTLTRQIEDLESQISNIDEYLEKYQERLDRMEENLRTKYAAAEQRISKLSQQASAISGILQQLAGNGGNNNNSSGS